MEDDYDSIIIGGASAGAVLTAPLSEDPAIRVLLLVAGRDFRTGDTRASGARGLDVAECSDARHASGTCRMGAADDLRSIVGPDAV